MSVLPSLHPPSNCNQGFLAISALAAGDPFYFTALSACVRAYGEVQRVLHACSRGKQRGETTFALSLLYPLPLHMQFSSSSCCCTHAWVHIWAEVKQQSLRSDGGRRFGEAERGRETNKPKQQSGPLPFFVAYTRVQGSPKRLVHTGSCMWLSRI